MSTEKHTSAAAAQAASDVLRDDQTGEKSKTAAASALSQRDGQSTEKHTSAAAAEAASDVLRDGRTSDKSKSAAASALSQRDGTPGD